MHLEDATQLYPVFILLINVIDVLEQALNYKMQHDIPMDHWVENWNINPKKKKRLLCS